MSRRGFALVPASDEDREALLQLKAGDVHTFEFRKQRNSAFHRKFFALLSVVAQYSATFDNVDKALVGVKLLTGHCDFVPHPQTGELVAVPKSISFSKMDETAFSRFYSNALDAVLRHMVPTMTRTSLETAINEVVGFA